MSEGHAYVEMVGVGEQSMDTRTPFHVAANDWPERCPRCSFRDIDAVPEPYRLVRQVDRPVEASGAELGNFFVKDRVRTILETVAGSACRFFPTLDTKTKAASLWWLAIPVQRVPLAEIDREMERCPAQGQRQLTF